MISITRIGSPVAPFGSVTGPAGGSGAPYITKFVIHGTAVAAPAQINGARGVPNAAAITIAAQAKKIVGIGDPRMTELMIGSIEKTTSIIVSAKVSRPLRLMKKTTRKKTVAIRLIAAPRRLPVTIGSTTAIK